MNRFLSILLPFLLICTAPAQRRAFEVASVKQNTSGALGGVSGRGGSMRATPGQITVENCSLWKLIGTAYGIGADKDYAIAGPDWIKTERYDIVAKMPADTPQQDLLAMLQTLLADRLKVAVHRESKELPMYGLVAAKTGSKLHSVEDGRTSFNMGPGLIQAQKADLTAFADRLSQFLDRPVVNMTGLPGVFDFKLEWTPDAPLPAPGETPKATDGPSIFTAIQEQLGLRLEARKGPVAVLVVDHAERVPTEN